MRAALPPKLATAADDSGDAKGHAEAHAKAQEWGWGKGELKVFSNNFRFASNVTTVLRDGNARLVLVLEGDAARQPYYREGNGLNVGLYGPVDTGRLVHVAAQPLPLLLDASAPVMQALQRREQLG